jgi:GAF domain-containing protein
MSERERRNTPDSRGLGDNLASIVDAAPHYWRAAGLQGILHTILEQLDELIDCDACAALLITDHTLRLAASRGLPEGENVKRLAFSLSPDSYLRQLIQAGQPAVLADVAAAGPFVGLGSFGQMRACIAAPMDYLGRPIGVLLVLKAEPSSYSAKDARSAMALARQAAMAIENARLMQRRGAGRFSWKRPARSVRRSLRFSNSTSCFRRSCASFVIPSAIITYTSSR